MFKRKFGFILTAAMLAIAVVLSGCTKEKSPQEAFMSSMSKSAEMKSYQFNGSLKIEDLSISDLANDPEAGLVLNLLKNAELSWTGAYRADPMMAEINLQLVVKGDMAVTIGLPIIVTDKKMWVKIPNIPLFPIVPEHLVDKYIELDLEQLAEESGQPMPSFDVAQSQKFLNDLLEIVFKHIEADQYIQNVKVNEAGLPSGVEAKQVIRLQVDQTKIEPLASAFVEKIAPEVIDLLSNNQEYRDMLQVTQEDLNDAKEGLKDADLTEGLAELNKHLKKLDLTANYGIDKNGYSIYSDLTFGLAVDTEQDGSFSMSIKVLNENTGINEEPKFEIGEPKSEDIITMEQLEAEFGGMGGFGSEF
ncbi:hypothetical protein ACF3MZ_25655 [Paenibacillaceae bacterium WGS1546]|uniref:hypothetical protein n=1 Tax=Cohnella sp. WGS1546 TaxID=3366810 RepID=UPI00372D5708